MTPRSSAALALLALLGCRARSGARGDRSDVVVIDRAHTGKATLAGAGIVCPWPSMAATGAYLELYLAGAGYYPTMIGDLADGQCLGAAS